MPLYKIIFEDSSTYIGGDSLYNLKWSDIPDKEILRLEFFMDKGSVLVLQDFESYNLFIEATLNIIGKERGQKLENIYIMGLRDDIVTSYRLSLIGERGQTKYIQGDVTRRDYPLGEEFRGRKTTCWKKGKKEVK